MRAFASASGYTCRPRRPRGDHARTVVRNSGRDSLPASSASADCVRHCRGGPVNASIWAPLRLCRLPQAVGRPARLGHRRQAPPDRDGRDGVRDHRLRAPDGAHARDDRASRAAVRSCGGRIRRPVGQAANDDRLRPRARGARPRASPYAVQTSVYLAYLLAFAVATIGLFFQPAKQTLIAELVGEDELLPANSLDQASTSAAELLGPGPRRGTRRRARVPARVLARLGDVPVLGRGDRAHPLPPPAASRRGGPRARHEPHHRGTRRHALHRPAIPPCAACWRCGRPRRSASGSRLTTLLPARAGPLRRRSEGARRSRHRDHRRAPASDRSPSRFPAVSTTGGRSSRRWSCSASCSSGLALADQIALRRSPAGRSPASPTCGSSCRASRWPSGSRPIRCAAASSPHVAPSPRSSRSTGCCSAGVMIERIGIVLSILIAAMPVLLGALFGVLNPAVREA